MTRIFIAFLWLFHWLPLPLQAAFGWCFGHFLYFVVAPRRKVVLTNLHLCFPELGPHELHHLARRNVVAVTRSYLERGLIWWGSAARVKRLVELRGLEKLLALKQQGHTIVILTPHFTNLDMGSRLGQEVDCVSVYSAQNNKLVEKMLLHGRMRFGNQQLLSRQEGIRGAVRAVKSGRPLYYLPDMDFGPKESIFVPFFGIQTATIAALPRIAKLANAVVIPFLVRSKPNAQGFVGEFGEVWEDFPTDDLVADTTRMNSFIEAEVRKTPEQYYWVHKRFKTRPEGEPRFY
jgi:Kdo2-lipid IVA lauroyltransferase/acyltransferase